MSGVQNNTKHAYDDYIVQAARQGLIRIPWYCKPPFTEEKRRILRRFNDDRPGPKRAKPAEEIVAAK